MSSSSVSYDADPTIFKVTNIVRETAGYPSLAVCGNRVYVAYQSVHSDRDQIIVAALNDSDESRHVLSSGQRNANQPTLFVEHGVLGAAWCELDAYRADLYVAKQRNGAWDEPRLIASAEGIESLCAVLDQDGCAMLLWAEQHATESDIWCVRPESGERAVPVTRGGVSYRPSACATRDGRLWIGFDCYTDESYRAAVTCRIGDAFAEPTVLAQPDSGWATSAALLPHGHHAVQVFWYAIGRGAKLRFWTTTVATQDSALQAQAPTPWADGRNWYAGLKTRPSIGAGQDLLVYNWGRQIHVRQVQHGQMGQPMMVSRPNTDDFNRRADAVQGPDGLLYVAFQRAPGNGHHERHSEIVVRVLDAASCRALEDPNCESTEDPFVQPPERQRGVIELSRDDRLQFRAKNPSYGAFHLMWGDIHGQNTLSDALGEMDQYYHAARSQAALDFVALTNHDVFPDELTPAEWDISRRYARVFNRPGELVTLQALEWTSNEYMEDFGHKNLYFPGEDPPLYLSSRDRSRTPTELFELLRQQRALCFPHHTAADWGIVSAATDWRYHDEEVQRNVEIFSRHAPFEYHGNLSPYTRNVAQFTGKSARDALAMGYTMGFTGGSDTHQMEHGLEGGLVAAYTTGCTRDAVFDALAARRIYATSGARILLSFALDDAIMGQRIVVKPDAALCFQVRAKGTDVITQVELIHDGQTVWSVQPNALDVDYAIPLRAPGRRSMSYAYVKVTQKDSHMAWSSPIWLAHAD